MPTNHNWAIIRDGPTFQSLVNTLILFERPYSQPFSRAGRDAGQDARSADGTCIFQQKFHIQPKMAKVLGDALGELVKIKNYRQPSHGHYPLWKDAKEWVLVTNVSLNPADAARWANEVVPKFKQVGLDAKLWSVEQLDALLVKHPHVREAYFEGKNRCFVSLEEAVMQAEADELGATGLQVGLEGRDEQKAKIMAFLTGSKSLLCFHGPGGIGKSRLLLEIGRLALANGYQVLSANVATMSKSETWFASLGYTEKTLLLVDEPQDPGLLHLLAEQLRTPSSQMKSWKVLIAVRSPKDPVMKAVDEMSADLREEAMTLPPLSQDAAMRLALSLINKSPSLLGMPEKQKSETATALSKLGGRYPIWIAMAAAVLAKHGNLVSLPSSVDGIAGRYLEEVIEQGSEKRGTKQQVQGLLRWLAIYEEINTDETAAITFIAKQAGFSNEAAFDECLNSLVARKFVVRRGINGRLFAIKPDVIREFILRTWLTRERDNGVEATEAARELVRLIMDGQDGKPVPNNQQLIRSLAKAELSERLQGHELDLLLPLVTEVMRLAKEGSTLQQRSLVGMLSSFAFARIPDLVQIVQTIRTTRRAPEEVTDLFQQKTIVDHESVVAQLAWPLFEAAHYAFTPTDRTAILQEMAQLALAGPTHSSLSINDGKRADSLIVRTIAGGRNFYSSFHAEGLKLARQYVRRLTATPAPSAAELSLTKTLCGPYLALERERTSFAGNTFTVERWFVPPRSPDGVTRDEIKNEIKQFLAGPLAAIESRLIGWELLSDAHSSANRAIIQPQQKRSPEFEADVRADLKTDLAWCLNFLEHASPTVAEMKAARHMWDWHAHYDSDPELKALAAACESVYLKHPDVAIFQVFFDPGQYEQAETRAKEIGDAIGAKGNKESINRFLDQAEAFGGGTAYHGYILRVSNILATHWATNHEIEDFVREALTLDPKSLKFQFAAQLVDRRLSRLRADGAGEVISATLRDFIAIPTIPAARQRLLLEFYLRPHPLVAGLMSSNDLEFIAGQMDADDSMKPAVKLRLLTGVCHVDSNRFRQLCTSIWERASVEERLDGFVALVEGLNFLSLFAKDYPQLQITPENYDWLLSLMIQLPDLDEVPETCQWELSQLASRFGHKGMAWMLAALTNRTALADGRSATEDEHIKVAAGRNRLTKYVTPLNSSDAVTDNARAEFEQLLAYQGRKDMLGYYLPRYAVDLDPSGVLVPDLVAAQIDLLQIKSKEAVRSWSRFAGHYGFNSPAWRTIARAALKASSTFSPQDQASVFASLLPQEVRSSSYPAGEMDPRPARDLALRKNEAESDTDIVMAAFRAWHLKQAQWEYDQTLASFQEEQQD